MSNFVQKKKVDKNLIDKLAELLNCGKDLAEVLAIRGYEELPSIQSFLQADIKNLTPVFLYSGMSEACARIKQAIDYGESIVIYGDYDCDGVCSTAILYMFLSSLGVEVNYYIPNRKKEGYGINREALEEIADTFYPDLIITVDCGITAKEDIEYAINELGIDFVITDHHEPPQDLPDCIVVNPKVDRKTETFNELCGAGIALRLCEAVGGGKALMYYMDLCAIATIGDIVPLQGDNRIIVSYGMEILNSRARLAVKLLLEVAGVKPEEKFTATDVAFKIVPRINAIGRLSDSKKAVSMLVDSDYFYVKSLAEQANSYNIERQQFTDDLVENCLQMLESYDLVNNRIIVLASDKWEAGVLGIAAAKITNLFNRPTILMTGDGEFYKGSARSVSGVNIYECVNACKSFLEAFGGHAMACGVTCKKESLESFCFAINEYARNLDENLFVPKVEYDLCRDFEDIDFESISELSRLEPYGMENPKVKYNISITTPNFARISTSKHIKFAKNNQVEMVYFDGFSNLKNINSSKHINMICDFGVRTFANRLYAQGIVQDTDFDWTDFSINEKYLAIKYAYYAKYDDSSVFNVKYIEEEGVLPEVENDLYGTCFIAYSKETFDKYSEILKDKVKVIDCNVTSSINPLNRLVLDLDISQNLAYYKKIVILDTLPSLGVIDYYKLNMNAQVVMVQNKIAQEYLQMVKSEFPDIDGMREIFAQIKKLLAVKTKITSFAELLGEYEKQGGNNTIAFYMAMFVFYELKIIKSKGGFFVDGTVKTSLDNSVIYQRIKELIYAGRNTR